MPAPYQHLQAFIAGQAASKLDKNYFKWLADYYNDCYNFDFLINNCGNFLFKRSHNIYLGLDDFADGNGLQQSSQRLRGISLYFLLAIIEFLKCFVLVPKFIDQLLENKNITKNSSLVVRLIRYGMLFLSFVFSPLLYPLVDANMRDFTQFLDNGVKSIVNFLLNISRLLVCLLMHVGIILATIFANIVKFRLVKSVKVLFNEVVVPWCCIAAISMLVGSVGSIFIVPYLFIMQPVALELSVRLRFIKVLLVSCLILFLVKHINHDKFKGSQPWFLVSLGISACLAALFPVITAPIFVVYSIGSITFLGKGQPVDKIVDSFLKVEDLSLVSEL